MPCQNGGECGNYIGGYLCHCRKDYYGGTCDSEYYIMMYIKTLFAQSTNYKSSDYVNGAKYRGHVVGLHIINTCMCK